MKRTNHRMGVPPRRKDVYFVEAPVGGDDYKFTCFSTLIEPVYTHWNGSRTLPCFEDHSCCEPSHSLLNIRWKGYLFGHSDKHRGVCFLQLTLEAANKLLDSLEGPTSLRGMILRVGRSRKTKGRMHCFPDELWREVDTKRLPEAPAVKKSLANLWRLDPSDPRPWTTHIEDFNSDGGVRIAEVS